MMEIVRSKNTHKKRRNCGDYVFTKDEFKQALERKGPRVGCYPPETIK